MTTTEIERVTEPGRLRVMLVAAVEQERLPEAITRPATYTDIWNHARRGQWTARDEHSAVRIPATCWAAVAIFCTGAGELAKWAVDPDGKPWHAVRNPRTPAQVYRHALSGDWGTSGSQVMRTAAHVRAAFVATAAAGIDCLAWTFQRFTRWATVTVSALLIGTAVAQLPVVGELVPTVINITAW